MNYCLNDEEVILFKEIAESNDFFEGDEVTVIITNFNLILFKEVKKFLRKPEYFEEVVPIRTIKYYMDIPYFKQKDKNTSMIQFTGNINLELSFQNFLKNKQFVLAFVKGLTATTLLERSIVKGKVALEKIEDYLDISIQETVKLALRNKFPGIVVKSKYLEQKNNPEQIEEKHEEKKNILNTLTKFIKK